MVKGRLKMGDPIFCVKIEHYVRAVVFEKALAQYFWELNEEFPEKLSKKKAEEILRLRLFRYGNQGSLQDGHFESSEIDYYEEYENRIKAAETFLRDKYPNLYED